MTFHFISSLSLSLPLDMNPQQGTLTRAFQMQPYTLSNVFSVGSTPNTELSSRHVYRFRSSTVSISCRDIMHCEEHHTFD